MNNYGCEFIMNKKALLIINPISGRGLIKENLLMVIRMLDDHGYEVVVYPTKAMGDASCRVQTAHDYDLIVVSGGDGTLNEVVTGMLRASINANIPIGYLPTGTINDMASNFNVPNNISKAIDICLTGKQTLIDVGQFNDRYFTYVAAFGAFTDVSYETPQPRKNMFGRMAYFLEGLSKVTTITSYQCKIIYPGGALLGDYILGMISNSNRVAGIKNIFGTHANISDGLFEVILVKKPKNIFEIRRILTDLLSKKYDPKHVIMFKTHQISIESKQEMKWTLDGENGGSLKKVEIKNLKQKIKILAKEEVSDG